MKIPPTTRLLLCWCALLIRPASAAYSQTPFAIRPGQPLTLTWERQVRLAVYLDSLQQAGAAADYKVRQLGAAAAGYRSAADSLYVALALSESRRINQEAVTKVWRVRARRRGLLVWGGAVAAGAVGYLLIFK